MDKLYMLIRKLLISLVILFFKVYVSYAQKDTCVAPTQIRETIQNYINYGDKKIYKKKFIKLFSEINKYHNECYFPGNGKDVKLYYYLGDSVLLKKIKTDGRAMELLINLYLLNKNNAELTEYYSTRIIPKAAVENTEAFIKVLSKKTDKEANKCINKLKYIESNTDKEKIREVLLKLQKKKYLQIINKIQESPCCR